MFLIRESVLYFIAVQVLHKCYLKEVLWNAFRSSDCVTLSHAERNSYHEPVQS